MYNRCMRTRVSIVFLSVVFALLTLAPYLLASSTAGAYRFTGFLFNPLDGASYLAKMQQGWEGGWQYALAFTDAPGPGAYLFLYYLFLGHVAHWFGLSLILTYHAARVVGASIFLIVAWWAFGKLGLTPRARAIAWATVLIGSGFGWTAALTGYAPSDLWVAEFVPFLSMLTSAHFPLAMALQLYLVAECVSTNQKNIFLHFIGVWSASMGLAILQPFALIPLALAMVAWIIWQRLRTNQLSTEPIIKLGVLVAGAAPFGFYDYWVTRSLPAFASWSAQNQTPTPPIWDIALAFGPLGLILLIALAAWMRQRGFAFSTRGREGGKSTLLDSPKLLLGLWLASIIVLMYLPIALQRRMMLGAMLPVIILAAPMIERWLFAPNFQPRRLLMGLLIFPLSNLIVLGAMTRAIQSHDPTFFLTPGQAAAMDWLTMHTAPGDVVMAPAELSKWIPGLTGLRVVYGHPMETPFAEAALADIHLFYQGDPAAATILQRHHVKWIYCDAQAMICPVVGASSAQLMWEAWGNRLFQVRYDR
jgi:hypothetical protein